MCRLTTWHDNAGLGRRLCALLAVTALALLVAALVRRPPPDFATRRVIAIVEDGAHHRFWTIRLAPAADEIAADSIAPPAAPPGRVYQLWLAAKDGKDLRQLGLLPEYGRQEIPLSPEETRLLAGSGQLAVTLEAAGGSQQPGPTGPVLFRAGFDGSAAEKP